ncbi:LysM peptidoglycan-binding domain-containing protein [Candidatus Woesearchaeota archaeon]|nr:LysM peptidoglycan-binding domain-containing protein [Candidatus Woesearchaeota archaeon]
MKRIILLMVLALMFLSVMAAENVAAENLCEKYGLSPGEECSSALKTYASFQQNSKLIKACTGKVGNCVDQSARVIAFGDRPLQENEIRALRQMGAQEVTADTRFYQVRNDLYSPKGLVALDHEAIAPPDRSETDAIIQRYQDGVPTTTTTTVNPDGVPIETITVGYDDFSAGLDSHLNPSGLVKVGEKISMLVYRESHLPSGLTPAQEEKVKQEKAKVWLEEITATIAELGQRKTPLPEGSVASLELSKKQLETDLPKIKEKYGAPAQETAKELIRAIDVATSKFQPPNVKLKKLKQKLNDFDAIDNPTPEQEEEANTLMAQIDELEQAESPQIGGIAVNPDNLGKKVDWLKCPDGCDYKVQKGDSYWNLAKRIPDADIRMEALMEMNAGKPLIAGVTTLRIPSKDEFLDYAFKKEKYFSPFQCR